MNPRSKYILFFLVLAVGIGLDQLTKLVARDHFVLAVYSQEDADRFQTTSGREIQPGMCKRSADEIPIAGRLFRFTYAENDGAFLSMGSTWNKTVRLWVLTVIPGLMLVGVMIFMLLSNSVGKTESWAFSLIAAGGIGNIIDRIFVGWVVDFMHMDFWGIVQTGVFNVADLYIMVGIGIYIVAYFRNRKAEAAADAAESTQKEA